MNIFALATLNRISVAKFRVSHIYSHIEKKTDSGFLESTHLGEPVESAVRRRDCFSRMCA